MAAEPIRRILVATDFSEVADEALEGAGRIAKKLGADLLLVHAHTSISDPAFGDLPPEMRSYAEGLQSRLQREAADAAALLDARAGRLPGGVRVQTKMLVGRPGDAIVDEARQSAAGLVVLGTHGRGAVGRAILGSVAHEVLRTAPCPVLLVGPRAERS
jgi:nucleotide-binding universal stress UspA family protein